MFEPLSVQNIVVILIQSLVVALCAWITALERHRRVFMYPTSARELCFPRGASQV
jgi:hypothetical protein